MSAQEELNEFYANTPRLVRQAIADLVAAVSVAPDLTGLAVEIDMLASDQVEVVVTPRLRPQQESVRMTIAGTADSSGADGGTSGPPAAP